MHGPTFKLLLICYIAVVSFNLPSVYANEDDFLVRNGWLCGLNVFAFEPHDVHYCFVICKQNKPVSAQEMVFFRQMTERHHVKEMKLEPLRPCAPANVELWTTK